MSTEKEYLAARVTLLDRETQDEQELTLYPITRVILKAPDGTIKRKFEVKNGQWVETARIDFKAVE